MSGAVSPGSPVADVLRDAQRLGFLGPRPIDEVIAHARVFARAAAGVAAGDTPSIGDIGAGGGVPGLVIAEELPNARLTLIDRRAKRTDFLDRVVRRLGWSERVVVRCADVRDLGDPSPAFDIVVARGFGPPDTTLRLATPLLGRSGALIISEPPEGDRWNPAVIATLGLQRSELIEPAGRVAIFRRTA